MVGMTIFDQLTQDQYDIDRNVVYEAWSCINDESMAARSRNPNAQKVIYSIKATAQFNSDIAVLLRDSMRRGKIQFLIDVHEAKADLITNKNYSAMSVEEQLMFDAPFHQTSAFVNELVNLDYEMVGGKVRVKERAGARKDRYSSISYANYIANEIERENRQIEEYYGDNIPMCVSSIDF